MYRKISEFLQDASAKTIQADATVMEAVSAMISERHDYVLVMEDGAIVGIFTERDFLNRVIGKRLLPAEIFMRDVMSPKPETLMRADYISYAIERMARHGFRNIPIVDENSPPAVLTVWNVMSHLSQILADIEESGIDKDIINELTDTGGG